MIETKSSTSSRASSLGSSPKTTSTMGVKIEVVFGEEPKDDARELVEDLVSIITSFAGKIYGMRSHKKTVLVQGVKKLIGELSGEDSEVKG